MNPDKTNTTAEEYYSLGVKYTQQAKLTEAEKAFREAIALGAKIPELYNYLGVILSSQGKATLEEIAQLFTQAITFNPDYGEAYYNLAIILNKQGRSDLAEIAYRNVIRINPQALEAYYNLGVVYSKQGLWPQSQACFSEAIKIKPDYTEANFNLGLCLKEQGLLDQAASALKKCLEQKSNYAPAYNSLGGVYKLQGNLQEAEEAFRGAIATKPDYLEAYNNLSVVLQDQGKIQEAKTIINQAITIKPDFHLSYNVLGSILVKEKNLTEAVKAFREAIALKPDYPEAYNNLAVVLTDLEDYKAASEAGLEALKLKPDYAEAYNNLAIVFLEQGNFAQAAKCCRRCLEIKPDYAQAYNNLGLILTEQRLLEPAITAFEFALKYKPDYQKVKFTHACTHLLAGNLKIGFAGYESRWIAHGLSLPNIAQPLWNGESLEGKKILLYGEQGLGDTIQFIRYAELLKAQGAKVYLACQSPLKELLKTVKSLEAVTTVDELNQDVDFYIPLLSIPLLLGTTLDNIPAPIPYINASKKIELEKKEAHKIGIVWKSGYREEDLSLYQLYKKKSCPVDLFISLLEIPDINLYSFQVGKDAKDILPYSDHPRVNNLSPLIKDFTDTAAMLEQMDLVISVDTSVAHLAGAMGLPVWLLLHYTPDWRWLLGRNDTPWYPQMRLFRQSQPGNWQAVFAEIIKLLRSHKNVEI